ncbi:inorganic pyrophosphatase [Candidatus Saccharibacteria bacterium]|nr:inorganic pyrophosphatase [Candidatus Saccharibacteria bacterium]
MEDLFKTLSRIVAESQVVIDRPKGSTHPRYPDYTYPLDYGYLEGTLSQDGGGIDVWLGRGDQKTITGILVIADALKKDSEIKVLLGCDESEMQQALEKSNQGDMSAALIRKESHEV